MEKYKIEISIFDPLDGPLIDLIINNEFYFVFEPTNNYVKHHYYADKNTFKECLFSNKMKEKDLLDMVNNYYRNWKIKYDALHSLVEVNEKGEIINE